MENRNRNLFIGALMIVAGILFALQTIFNIDLSSTIIATLFVLGGAAFLWVLATRPQTNWWAAIPGMTLIGLGALIGLPALIGEAVISQWGGTLFLGMISLSFVMIYFLRREFWWAVIPAGTLLTLALVAGLSDSSSTGFDTGALFFVGLGLTFGILGLLPEGRKMRWPWIPATILLIMGGLVALGSETYLKFLFPAALILAGVFFLFRSFQTKP